MIGQPERLLERFAYARDHGHHLECRIGGAETRQHEHEFIAAETRDGVALTDGLRQPLGDRLQQLVAGVVTQRIVDPLEVIEVEKEACDLRAVAKRLRQNLPQPLIE